MRQFDADDIKVYKAWLRRTAAIYAGLILVGAAAIGTLAITNSPTVATYLATAVNFASP